tara:strand:- start:39 stop:1238 length:1200 start_codon:yes stop_codon:yes gene_type:complete
MSINSLVLRNHAPTFDIAQQFATVGSPNVSIPYVIVPTGGKQSRLARRVSVKPVFELSQFRAKAVIDWLDIDLGLPRQTQGVHINRTMKAEAGVSVYAQALEKSGLIADSSSDTRTSDRFRIRLQEPTRFVVEKLLAVLGSRWGGVWDPILRAIEVSVDFKPRVPSNSNLYAMTGLLQRHFVPFSLNAGRRGARPRVVVESSVGSKVTRHLFDPKTHVYCAPYVDGTLYFGAREDPISWRIMAKVSDQRTGSVATELTPDLHRSRIEVTLQREALVSLGIVSLEDLSDFRFERLKTEYFGFWIPTVPGVVDGAGMIKLLPVGYRHLDIFRRSGAYQFLQWEKALLEVGISTSLRAGWRKKSDPSVLARRRLLGQEHLYMLAYAELNRRTEDALRGLAWS